MAANGSVTWKWLGITAVGVIILMTGAFYEGVQTGQADTIKAIVAEIEDRKNADDRLASRNEVIAADIVTIKVRLGELGVDMSRMSESLQRIEARMDRVR